MLAHCCSSWSRRILNSLLTIYGSHQVEIILKLTGKRPRLGEDRRCGWKASGPSILREGSWLLSSPPSSLDPHPQPTGSLGAPQMHSLRPGRRVRSRPTCGAGGTFGAGRASGPRGEEVRLDGAGCVSMQRRKRWAGSRATCSCVWSRGAHRAPWTRSSGLTPEDWGQGAGEEEMQPKGLL